MTWNDEVKFGPPTPKKIRTVSPTLAWSGCSLVNAPTEPFSTKYSGRNLHRYPARPTRQRGVQRREAFDRGTASCCREQASADRRDRRPEYCRPRRCLRVKDPACSCRHPWNGNAWHFRYTRRPAAASPPLVAPAAAVATGACSRVVEGGGAFVAIVCMS